MPFISQLGKADSRLGNIQLGKLTHIIHAAGNTLALTQTVAKQVTLTVNASNTLVQSNVAKTNTYLQRIVSGLVARENFESLSGWTNVGTGWSSESIPGMISYPSPRVLLDRGVEGVDADGGGIREPHLVIVSPSEWHLFADAGDGSDPAGANGPWQIKRYSSSNRGLTWTRHGNITLNKTGSNYSGHVTFDMAGWITKVGSTYYMQVLSTNSLIDGRVPNVPYVNAVYSASSLSGTWTWVHDSPLLGTSGQFDENTVNVSHVFHDGSQWVGYYSAKTTGSVWGIGRATTSSLASAWTKDGAGQVLPSAVWLDSAFENPKIWYSNILNKWLMVGNGNVRDTEELFIASTEADFRTSDVKRLQLMQLSSPMYTRNTLSIISPVSRESGEIWQEDDDIVPAVYAGDRDTGAPNNFEWHRIRVTQLEPFTHVARYNTSSVSYLTKTDPLVAANGGDGVYEFQVEPHSTGTGKNIGFHYRSTGGTSDAGTTGYYLNIETNTWKVQFFKNASGTFTQLGTDYTIPYRFEGDTRNSNTCRIKIVTSGNNHKIYVNGALAFDPVGGGGGVNDSTYTGSLYGFRGSVGVFDIRGLVVRRSDTVTVTGLLNGVTTTLRGPSGYPIATGTSSGAAPVTFSLPYGHANTIETAGREDFFDGKIWGGDEFTLLDTGGALSYYQYYQTMTHTKTLNKSVTNSITWTQTAVIHKVKDAANTLTLSHTVDVTKSKPAINTLALTQILTVQTSPHNIHVQHVLPIGHQLVKITSQSYKAANAVGFNQTIKKWKQFDRSITTPLVLAHNIVRERFNRSITTPIIWTHEALGQRVQNRSIISNLALTQTVICNKVINRTLITPLIFLNNHQQYIPIGNVGNVTINNLLVTNTHQAVYPQAPTFHQDSSGRIHIAIPQSPKKIPPYCTLSVPERTVTLPAAEWSDSEGYGGVFTIRRSMTGGTFTYVHRLDTDKLKYDFVFGLRKAREVKDYLLNFNSRIHTLVNWKGEIWYVFLTNNPFEMLSGPRYSNALNDTFDDREKIRITMEFEGKRIN